MSESAPTFLLKKVKVSLVRPTSYALRFDVVHAAAKNTNRAFAAALGVCGVGRRLKLAYNNDPMDYGGKVIDALHELGIPMEHIVSGGAEAWNYLAKDILSMDAVTEAADFTDPEAEDSTS